MISTGIFPSDISAIVNDGSFAQLILNKTAEVSRLIQAGIVTPDPVIASAVSSAGIKGATVILPFWNDIGDDDDAEIVNTKTNMTPSKTDASQDVAVIIRRRKSFASEDLVAELAGDDPIALIVSRFANFWARQRQKAVMAVLKGVFASEEANGKALTLDLSTVTLTSNCILQAAELLGDAKDNLTALAMNSRAEMYLNILGNSGTLYKPADTPARLSTFNGKSVVADDMVPCVAYDSANAVTTDASKIDHYIATIYLFGAGAVANNDAPTKTPSEFCRDTLGDADIVATRQSFIAHVRGFKWKGTPAGSTPTNAELETAANWTRVWDAKQIRVIKLLVKIPAKV